MLTTPVTFALGPAPRLNIQGVQDAFEGPSECSTLV